MAENVLDLSSTLNLDATPWHSSMDATATSAEAAFSEIAGHARAFLGTAGLIKFFNNATNAANDFGQKMADLAAITDLSIQHIGKSIKDLPNYFGDPGKIADTIYEVVSSGFRDLDESQLMRFQKAISVSSRVIRADVYNTGDAMTTLANAYKLTINEVERLQDWFYTTVVEGKAHGDELARTLGLVVNNAAESNIKLKELGAAIGILSRTQSTSQSMIGLNQMINSLIKPTLKAKAAAREWGIELGANALEAKGFTETLRELHTKVGGNTEALENMFGNIRAGRAVLSLTGRQFNDFMKVLESYDKTAGAGQEAFNKQIATTQVAFESLSTQATKTMITIGEDTSKVTSTIAKLQEAVFKGFADADKWARWSVYILAANYAMGLLRDSLSKLASGGIGGRVASLTGKVKGDVHSARTGVENVVDSTRRATSATADLHRQWLAVADGINTATQSLAQMQSSYTARSGTLGLDPESRELLRKRGSKLFYPTNQGLKRKLSDRGLGEPDFDVPQTRSRGFRLNRAYDTASRVAANASARWDVRNSLLGHNNAYTKSAAESLRRAEERVLRIGIARNEFNNRQLAALAKARAKETATVYETINLTRSEKFKRWLGREVGIGGTGPKPLGARGQVLDAAGRTSLDRYKEHYGAEFGSKGMSRIFQQVASSAAGKFVSKGVSIIGKLGMGIAGVWGAIDIGWNIGKAISDKFDFANTTFFKSLQSTTIGGILAGILGQGFGEGVENVDSKEATNIAHNQRMYQKETARLINSSKELTIAAKAELAVRNAQVKSVEQAIAVQADVKKAIEERIEALSTERKLSRQVTEAMARYKEASDQATKTLNERKDANKIITEEVANKLRNELRAQGGSTEESRKAFAMTLFPLQKEFNSALLTRISQLQELNPSMSRKDAMAQAKREVTPVPTSTIEDPLFGLEFLKKLGIKDAKLPAFTQAGLTDNFYTAIAKRMEELQGKGQDITGKSVLPPEVVNALLGEGIPSVLKKLGDGIEDGLGTQFGSKQFDTDISMAIRDRILAILPSDFTPSSAQRSIQRERELRDLEGERASQVNYLSSAYRRGLGGKLKKSATGARAEFDELAEEYDQITGGSNIDVALSSLRQTSKDVIDEQNNLYTMMDSLDKALYDFDMVLARIASKGGLTADEFEAFKAKQQLQIDEITKNAVEEIRAAQGSLRKSQSRQESQRIAVIAKAAKQAKEDTANLIASWFKSLNIADPSKIGGNLAGVVQARLKSEISKTTGYIKSLYGKMDTAAPDQQAALDRQLSAARSRLETLHKTQANVDKQVEAYDKMMAEKYSTIMEFTKDQDAKGKLTNNAMYHALRLLGQVNPGAIGAISGGTQQYDGYDKPYSRATVERAQNAQLALSTAMDKYIMEQKEKDSSMASDVSTIAETIAKRQPVFME